MLRVSFLTFGNEVFFAAIVEGEKETRKGILLFKRDCRSKGNMNVIRRMHNRTLTSARVNRPMIHEGRSEATIIIVRREEVTFLHIRGEKKKEKEKGIRWVICQRGSEKMIGIRK